MDLSTRARRRIATALALLLAVESVTAVTVAAATLPMATSSEAGPAAATLYTLRAAARPVPAASFRVPATAAPAVAFVPIDLPEVVAPTPAPDPAPAPRRHALPEGLPSAVAAPAATPSPAHPAASRSSQPKPASKPASTHRSGTTSADYQGTNQVWIPSLGISRSVRWFPCDRQRAPDNFMYRWGCAGSNNVYLMGHAWGVMAPLHDAYVSGRLRVGMKAWYAGSDGRVHVYAVRWWRLTRPTTDAAWAWAAQDVPSMTLQTCVGKNSEYRLMVRLVEVDG